MVVRKSPDVKHQEMIDDIIENFNFERCHDVMKHLGWVWVGGTPTIERLKEAAEERLKCAIEGALDRKDRLPLHSSYFSSSGGLKATAWRNRYYQIEGIKLEFVLSEWDSDGD